MQITTALTLHTILAEEQFSLDELVIELRRVVQEEGLSGLLRLVLEALDELWAIRACRENRLPGVAGCGHGRWEVKDRVPRRLRTGGGVVQFKWRRLVCRVCGKQTVPMRQWLGLQRWQSKTGELEQVVMETVADQSYRRSTRHLETIGVIPVPKSTAHRWVAQSGCDQTDWPKGQLPTLLADGTGYKERPDAGNGHSNKGELRVVIGLDDAGKAVPVGTWSNTSWEQIAAELEHKAGGKKLGQQLSCDGEPGLADRLARLVNSVQRCHWHMVHDLDRLMWFDRAPLKERRQEQAKMAGMIGIQLPAGDFQSVKEQDKQALEEQVGQTQRQLSDLVRSLQKRGYDQAATYVAQAQGRLFSYVDFWLQTGVISPRTSSYIERLMREIGRRLKRIAFGWSAAGAAKMARIIIRRLYSPEQWSDYWKNFLKLNGHVIVQFRSVKIISP